MGAQCPFSSKALKGTSYVLCSDYFDEKIFSLCLEYLSVGLSLRQVTRIISITKQQAGLGYLNGIYERKVASFARLAVVCNLQKLSDLLQDRRTWAFSIAFDGATCNGTSFLDVRVRMYVNNDICNFHLLAVPMYERHTGLAMFQIISSLFNALCYNWRYKLLSVATDGARNMTGSHAGVVSRLAAVALPGFYRVWCGAHQLDLAVQSCVQSYANDSFYGTLTALIGYLRRKQTLVTNMRSTCPKVATTRWLSLGKVTKWLLKHRATVLAYLNMKKPNCTPEPLWWLLPATVHSLMSDVDVCFKSLQGMQTTVRQQQAYLEKLVCALKQSMNMQGPFLSVQDMSFATAETEALCSNSRFLVTTAAVELFIEDQGIWASRFYSELSAIDKEIVVRGAGVLFTRMAEKVSLLQSERNLENASATETLPPVCPQDLLNLSPREFNAIVLNQQERLLTSWDEVVLDGLQRVFQEFKRSTNDSPILRESVDRVSATQSFCERWAPVERRFNLLRWFCGTLATTCPGTPTVEGDFSVINWEYDVYRQSLTSFSLEGILQAKQHKHLSKAAHVIDAEASLQ